MDGLHLKNRRGTGDYYLWIFSRYVVSVEYRYESLLAYHDDQTGVLIPRHEVEVRDIISGAVVLNVSVWDEEEILKFFESQDK
jgi:hypothetical protein